MPPDAPHWHLRDAGAADASAIADLHARSWRSAYRGSLSDAYLDGPILAERQAVWAERLRHPAPDRITILADQGNGALAGFVCAVVDYDTAWGTLVDNLHVDPDLRRGGLGRILLRAIGGRLKAQNARGPVHLFVLAANGAAGAFYERLGGEAVEAMIKTQPDGSTLPVNRIAWPSVATFTS